MEPVNYHPSSDWMEKLREREALPLPEEHIVRFGKGDGGRVVEEKSVMKQAWRRWVWVTLLLFH